MADALSDQRMIDSLVDEINRLRQQRAVLESEKAQLQARADAEHQHLVGLQGHLCQMMLRQEDAHTKWARAMAKVEHALRFGNEGYAQVKAEMTLHKFGVRPSEAVLLAAEPSDGEMSE